MKFDGKIISRDTFIQLLDEGLPSIQNYEWYKNLIVKNENMLDFSKDGSGRKILVNYHERCFCVINKFKEALVFRYFMIRNYRNKEFYFREVYRRVYIGEYPLYIVNGRYYSNYSYIFTKESREWKLHKPGYYDTVYIGCDGIIIDKVPEMNYVKVMLECYLRNCSDTTIENIIRAYLKHPKYEILWKANGIKFYEIKHIDKFSNKKLVFIGKNQLEDYYEVLWNYDYYDLNFIKKIRSSYKLEILIKKLKTYGIDKFQLARFIKKQDTFDCSDYMDYLDNLKTLEIDVKANAFPKDYEEEHTRLFMQIQYIKQGPVIKEYGQKYIETMKSLLPLERTDKYSIVIPKCIEDFLREGQVQRICVFANGYYKSVIKHKSIILFVRTIDRPDKPYICVELDELFNVVQARGFSNERAPKEVNDYLVDVTNEYKQMYGDLNQYWNKVGECYANV